jgi:hypothetical protein
MDGSGPETPSSETPQATDAGGDDQNELIR